MFEKDTLVMLRYKTAKHPAGAKAKVISCPSASNDEKMDLRFEGELYINDEVETYPISLFQPVRPAER